MFWVTSSTEPSSSETSQRGGVRKQTAAFWSIPALCSFSSFDNHFKSLQQAGKDILNQHIQPKNTSPELMWFWREVEQEWKKEKEGRMQGWQGQSYLWHKSVFLLSKAREKMRQIATKHFRIKFLIVKTKYWKRDSALAAHCDIQTTTETLPSYRLAMAHCTEQRRHMCELPGDADTQAENVFQQSGSSRVSLTSSAFFY